MTALDERLALLTERLAGLGSVVVAFSGGVDSALLLDVAFEVLGDGALAATARSHTLPERELSAAQRFCAERNIAHVVLDTNELAVEGFRDNPPNRCYLCKRELYGRLAALAASRGFRAVVEGSNLDDEGDYRPGLTALAELGVISPLREQGFTKDDVRSLSHIRGLPTWNKPSSACLASRLPYGMPITPETLARVEAAETWLIDAGLVQVRVRAHGDVARIECDEEGMALLTERRLARQAHDALRGLGFTFVALDLGGFESGSMNRAL
ncbi:MAG: ATP-dependent sacrificial sulfur transferase LarE [Coriobacteriales bacterium]|jgi:uncharacterized protein|nr:ATP-dependent sacrificial sulfur transferase LarE [Coriobacteriales bacterium]